MLLAFHKLSRALDCAAHLLQEARGAIRASSAAIDDVVDSVTRDAPDVVLLEFARDDVGRCSELLGRIGSAGTRTRVLVLWERYSESALAAFVRHGVSGCLLASSPPAMYLKAVTGVHAGQCWFGRTDLVKALRKACIVAAPSALATPIEADDVLTGREREILTLIGTGLTNKEIARRLTISEHTVKTHLHHVYVKLESSGRYKAYLSGSRSRPRIHLAAETLQAQGEPAEPAAEHLGPLVFDALASSATARVGVNAVGLPGKAM